MKRVALLLCLAPFAFAQTQVPNVFEDGQPAKAAEVNANFDALLERISALESQLEEQQILSVANKTYRLHFWSTRVERFDANPQNSSTESGFWNVDLENGEYSLTFNNDADRTASLEVIKDTTGDLYADGSLHLNSEVAGEIETLFWTQNADVVSLAETLGGVPIARLSVVEGATVIFSSASDVKLNADTGNDSCGNGSERCYGDSYKNLMYFGLKII